jgi:RNA polymerase sigma factor (sigma-70 family)
MTGLFMTHSTADSLADCFLSYRNELFRFIFRQVGCSDTADDILQDTYLRFSGYAGEQAIKNPRAFLYRIAANLATDHARANRRRSLEPLDAHEIELPDEKQHIPETLVEQQQHLESLYKALTELPPLCREVFILSRFEGQTHEQIAARLCISTSWVEKNIVQALKHCKRQLQNEG